MKHATKNDSTEEIATYLCRVIRAAQFGIPSEEVPKLQELVTELEKRAEDWDGS